MKDEFLYSYSSTINNDILDSLNPKEKIVSVSLNIKASHAGKVNGNYVFYTPRSMVKGSSTLLHPFKKHLQRLHRGDAVGVINDAEYKDYTENYSDKIKELGTRINSATSQQELVKAVKELVNSPEYKSKEYKGLGVLTVAAELFDSNLIHELTSGDNKGKVSIGGNSNRVYCSVCSQLFDRDHEHKRGKVYDGETCFAIYDNMFLDHIGFVPDPADTNTETNIIFDSIQDNDSTTVTIDNFKIQDNLQGHLMNIEQLKQSAKEVESLVDLVTTGKEYQDVQKEALKTQLAKDYKTSRKSGYLFSEEKLLPLTSKESVAVAVLLIESLEDSSEKTVLLDILKTHVEKHFAEGTPSDHLSAFGLPVEEEKVKEEAKAEETTAEEVKEEEKATETEATEAKAEEVPTETKEETVEEVKTEEVVEQAKPTEFAFSEEALERLVSNVAQQVAEKLLEQTNKEPAKVEDSVNYDILLQNNKQLTFDVEALSSLNTELTNKCKTVIISQILSLKGLKGDDKYAEILSGRDLTSLTDTLQDLEYTSAKVVEEATPATSEVKDSLQEEVQEVVEETPDTVTEEVVEETLEKVALSDSLNNLKEDDKTKQQEAISTDLQILKDKGLAAYLRERKNK